MRIGHLESYSVELRLLSPLFIGSSAQETLNSKECAIDRTNRLIYVPDLSELVHRLSATGRMEQFEAFLNQASVPGARAEGLYDFLSRSGFPMSADAPWVQYTVHMGEDYNTVNQLKRCVKDLQGHPYIPGSSIKGAIRTALLSQMLTNPDDIIDEATASPKNRLPSRQENLFRTLALNKCKSIDGVNDLLKGLEISDSEPILGDSLVICQKVEASADGRMSTSNRLPVFRECILPNIKARFRLTIDTSVSRDLTLERIKKALVEWNKKQTAYIDSFDLWNIDLYGLTCKGTPITLGGGTGFQTKSLIFAHSDIEKIKKATHSVLSQQFYRTYKRSEDSADPAPYKLKLVCVNQKYYPLGRCEMIFGE